MKQLTAEKLTRRQIDVGAVAVLAVLTGLAYLLILQPIAQRQGDLASLRTELTTTRGQAASASARRSALDTRLTRVRAGIDASPVQLEPVEHLNRRIARIVELASQSGMIIHETHSSEIEEARHYRAVPIEISGSGSYSRCAAFMHRVYDDLPDVEVDGFELSGNPAQPSARSTFRFDLVWYASTARTPASLRP